MPLSQDDLNQIAVASKREFGGQTADPFGAAQNQTFMDWVGSFARSGVENTTNLFGVPKSVSNIAWEESHPMSALAASFLGIGGTYGTFYKATKALRGFEKGLDTLSGVARAPVLGGAAKEAMRFAPLEAARIVGTAIGEPERLDETLFESGVGIGIAGGLGALGGLPAKFGTVDKAFKELIPNVDDSLPRSLKLRELRKLVDEGKVAPEQLTKANTVINQLDKMVRAEYWTAKPNSPNNPRYITDLEATEAGQKLTKTGFVNSIFKPQENGLFRSQLLLSKNDVTADALRFAMDDESAVAAVLARLPDKAMSYVQYPRLVTITGDKKKALTLWQNNWAKGFSQYEPGSYIGREADEGMFLFLKKIKGDPNAINKDDQFLIFKTDRPDLFGGQAAAWTNKQVEQAMWWPQQFPQNAKPLPGSAHEYIRKELERMPIRSIEDLTKGAKPETMIQRAVAGMGLKQGSNMTDGVRAGLEHLKTYLAPAMFLFSGDGPGMMRARRAFFAIKSSLDRANSTAEALVYGLPHATKGSLAKNLLVHGTKDLYNLGDETIAGLVGKLDDADRGKLLEVWLSNTPIDVVQNEAVKGNISQNLLKLLTSLDNISNKQFEEINAVRAATGQPVHKAKPGHYGLSHMWDGDWRLRVRNQNGAVVYMVGAHDRGTAQKYANAVIKNAGMEGKWKFDASEFETKDLFRRGKDGDTSDWTDLVGINTAGQDYRRAASAMERFVRETYKPKALERQQGVEGFSVDMSAPALTKRLLTHFRRLQNYSTDMALKFELGPDMLKLQDENKQAFQTLIERWNTALGIQGKFAQMQNDVLDKSGVGAVLGNNSASQIVAAANTLQHNLQLGMGNLMYPTVNMFTFLSTVLPQVSFVQSAAPEVLQKYYGSLMAHGADGLAKRPVHFLDPMKMVYQGFRLMSSGDQGVKKQFDRALADGLFAPRLVEEHIGVDAQLKQRLSGILQEKNGFPKFLQYLSEWLPNKSEQFSRLHAFTTGLSVGKDVLGLADEGLYRFARDFTHNTMFGYNMVDRAKVINGPLGSFFGLYKNWQMHYAGWLLAYAGEAARGNMAPLLWSQAGVGTIAGLGGTALYGLGDAFARMATGKSGFDYIYDTFSTDGKPDMVSDTAFYGLPAFFNLSLQSSASGLGSNPAKDAALLFSFVQAERGAALGKALGNAFDTWSATGKSPFADPIVRGQMLKAIAPRSVLRTAQVLEGDYIRSLNTGNPLIQGLSPMDRFVYGLGFNTPEMDRTYKISDELFKNEEKRKVAVRYYAREMLDLQESQDWEGLTLLTKRVMLSGVGMDSVIRSAQGMRQRNLQDVATSRVKKASPEYLQRYLEE